MTRCRLGIPRRSPFDLGQLPEVTFTIYTIGWDGVTSLTERGHRAEELRAGILFLAGMYNKLASTAGTDVLARVDHARKIIVTL